MGSGNAFQNIFETSIYYGCLCWQYGVQGINFLVGIVHVLHIVDEPGIAVSVWILDRNCLSLPGREDEILRVQHIQNAELGSIHTVHLTTCGSDSPIGGLHFGGNMTIYHFLITSQFGCMISTYALVPVRSFILAECISGKA